jgi:hypothetical protein
LPDALFVKYNPKNTENIRQMKEDRPAPAGFAKGRAARAVMYGRVCGKENDCAGSKNNIRADFLEGRNPQYLCFEPGQASHNL